MKTRMLSPSTMRMVCSTPAPSPRSGHPVLSIDQDGPEQARLVGHDPIYSEVQEPVHLVGVINGPDVDLEAPVVCMAHESAVHERDASLPYRNLEALG